MKVPLNVVFKPVLGFTTSRPSPFLAYNVPDISSKSRLDKIVRCTNGVGEWEIQPTHETFDTREEAEEALAKYTEEDEDA